MPTIKLEIIDSNGVIEDTKKGRLLGFIDQDESNAIINTKDSHDKVFTSESRGVRDFIGRMVYRRLLIATDEGFLFISPKIKSIVLLKDDDVTSFSCEDGKTYKLLEK